MLSQGSSNKALWLGGLFGIIFVAGIFFLISKKIEDEKTVSKSLETVLDTLTVATPVARASPEEEKKMVASVSVPAEKETPRIIEKNKEVSDILKSLSVPQSN